MITINMADQFSSCIVKSVYPSESGREDTIRIRLFYKYKNNSYYRVKGLKAYSKKIFKGQIPDRFEAKGLSLISSNIYSDIRTFFVNIESNPYLFLRCRDNYTPKIFVSIFRKTRSLPAIYNRYNGLSHE